MHSVPTLCATATIIGVSSVGYALARRTEFEAASNTAVPPVPPSTTRTTTLLGPAGPSSSPPLPSPSDPTDRPRPLSRRLSSSRQPNRPVGRRSIGDLPLPRIRDDDEELVNQSDSDILDRPPQLWPRSSCVRRVSSRSVHGSPASSPRAESPAMSTSVSYNGSTAPMIPGHTVRPLPPNKLVKRSSSSRVPDAASSGSRLLFRKPATSHQRAQTVESYSPTIGANPLWHQRANESPSAIPHLTETDQTKDLDGQWQQYFTARVSKELLTKKRSSAGDVHYVKRIVPDDRCPPTLIMAKALSAAAVDIEELSSQDGDSIFYSSRPVTPSGFETDSSALNRRVADRTQSSPSLQRQESEPKPRRSFSISDFLTTGPPWGAKSKPPKTPKYSRKTGRRVFSSPLVGLGGRHSIDVASERPYVRRDITDPLMFRKNIDYSSSGTSSNMQRTAHDLPLVSASRSLTNSEHSPGPRSSSAIDDSPLLTSHPDLSRSPTLSTSVHRPSRYSTATSERASTLVGSDNEFRSLGSGDDDDSEVNDDAPFGSFRMRTVRSSSKQRGPMIETIFDESPPKPTSKDHMFPLRDVSPNSARKTRYATKQFEQENISTPTRHSIHNGTDSSPSLHEIRTYPVHEIGLPSSPPGLSWTLPKASKDEDDDAWFFEEEDDTEKQKAPFALADAQMSPLEHSLQLTSTPKSSSATPRHLGSESADKRSSIFDWAEQQPNERTPSNTTPPRPRTVHGKKDPEVRGPRSSRRAPSGLHARSQSVPVVPDISGKRGTTGTNKFGTWGVGSKGGVPEDWDDDFDFGDTEMSKEVEEESVERRIDSGVAMRVPDSIREQQSNVMANIGLLREWGLLIEELKQLRVRAIALGVLHISPSDIWQEVDAMIDLADQEAEDEVLEPPSFTPPSSPGFDTDAFDELSLEPVTVRHRSASKSPAAERYVETITPALANPPRLHRKSILSSEHDIFGPVSPAASTPTVPTIKEEATPQGTPKKESSASRPRKDSEAVARSVIEMLQQRRSTQDPLLPLQPVPQSKKVPFDTATLRHIVPYVHGLMRKVKDVIRDAEGLYRSPNASPRAPDHPTLSQIFQPETPDHSPTRRPRRLMSIAGSPSHEEKRHSGNEGSSS